jgi:hypothetical protein
MPFKHRSSGPGCKAKPIKAARFSALYKGAKCHAKGHLEVLLGGANTAKLSIVDSMMIDPWQAWEAALHNKPLCGVARPNSTLI